MQIPNYAAGSFIERMIAAYEGKVPKKIILKRVKNVIDDDVFTQMNRALKDLANVECDVKRTQHKL